MRGASGIRIVAPKGDVDRHAGPVQGHGVATVWDVSQTDGGRGARPSIEPVTTTPPKDVFAGLAQVAVAAGYSVERRPLLAALGGAETDHRRRRIAVLEEFDDSVAALGLAHELAHLRMHKLSRDAGCHGLARLEATSVAYTLLARFGVVPGGASADLIASATGTLGRSPAVRLVETLGGRVVAAAGRLIEVTERHVATQEGLRSMAPTTSNCVDEEDRELHLGL